MLPPERDNHKLVLIVINIYLMLTRCQMLFRVFHAFASLNPHNSCVYEPHFTDEGVQHRSDNLPKVTNYAVLGFEPNKHNYCALLSLARLFKLSDCQP